MGSVLLAIAGVRGPYIIGIPTLKNVDSTCLSESEGEEWALTLHNIQRACRLALVGGEFSHAGLAIDVQ